MNFSRLALRTKTRLINAQISIHDPDSQIFKLLRLLHDILYTTRLKTSIGGDLVMRDCHFRILQLRQT
jgi:hypothetical protein